MQTIIQNYFILEYYNFKNIDIQLIDKIEKSNVFTRNKKTFINLLSSFLFISNQNLRFLDLSSNKFQKIIDDFHFFVDERYLGLSSGVLSTIRNDILKWVKSLKDEIPSLKNYEVSTNKDNFDCQFNQEKIDYIQGWFLKGKDNKKQIFINLIAFYELFGSEKTKEIYKNAQIYCSKFELETNKQFLSMLNEFSIFLKSKNKEEAIRILYSDIDILNLMKDFCFVFFKKEQDSKRALYNSKKKWNKFIEAFQEIFLNDSVFPKISTNLPRAPNKDRKGFEKRISIKNGIEVKSKLITEIPLNITDDEALEILFKKINSDVDLTLLWANSSSQEFLNVYDNSFPHECFNKSSLEIKKILGSKCFLRDMKNELLTTNSLELFMFLLINEHPQITESFLVNFELYDTNNNLSGYLKIDDNFYLVGYKKRRGADLAEQKVLLNETSKKIIDNIIYLTSNYREYLRKQNNDSWKYLFIHGGENGIKPQRLVKTFVPAPSNLNIYEGKKRIDFIMNNSNCSLENATRFVTNMTMTKLRASKAVQLYLIQNDTQKMAEALGHKYYRPELLSFYLPETILNFFQSRWIRIFQKGIICEAMKDSENLFKSTNFETINDLENFLQLHSLKNIPDVQNKESQINLKDEIYIGVNQEILRVLLSLEKAVELAGNEVSAKALYWAKFSNRLQEEILNNKSNVQFLKDLEKAKNQLNPQIFKDVIYDK